MTTFYFISASKKFLTQEEPLQEVLHERARNYKETNKKIDFWLVINPAFIKILESIDALPKIPKPCAAVISTDEVFIKFLKLRLEFVAEGQFNAPTNEIPDPLATLD